MVTDLRQAFDLVKMFMFFLNISPTPFYLGQRTINKTVYTQCGDGTVCFSNISVNGEFVKQSSDI